MAVGNTADIVGHLTRAPELRFTPGGMAVAQVGVAVSHRRQVNGEWKEQTSFVDVKAFGTLAENVAESLDRGARVLVQGRLEQESWETEAGDKRSKVLIVADEMGPSLRWATCEVTKNEKREGSSGGGGQTQNDQPPIEAYDETEPF